MSRRQQSPKLLFEEEQLPSELEDVVAIQHSLADVEAVLRRTIAAYASDGPYTSLSDLERNRRWIGVLRKYAKRILRDRLQSLTRRIKAAGHPAQRHKQPALIAQRDRLESAREDGILIELGVPAIWIGVGTRKERERFVLEEATCDACPDRMRLTHFDAAAHGIEAEQLGCTKCGAMFDLDAFLR